MKKLIFIPGIVMAMALITSCEDMWHHCFEGNGHTVAETRTLTKFTRIQVNGDFKVLVDTGSTSVATVEADENLLDLIVTHVSGDKLIIETRDGDCLNPSHPIEINVTTPSVNNIELNGSGNVYCYGLKSEDLILKLSGSGQIECTQVEAISARLELVGSGNIHCSAALEDLHAEIEGSGEIRINGSALNSELRVNGSGRQRASQFNTDVCVTYIVGSGIIDTDVNNSLDVTIMGSGIVNYLGNPVVTSYISGSGKIVKQ